MRNWKVGARLGLAFALLLALMLLGAGIALVGVRAAGDEASRLESETMRLLEAANAMRVAQLNEAVAIRDFVGLADVKSQQQALVALRASEKEYAEAAAVLEQVVAGLGSAQMDARVARVKKAGGSVAARLRQAIELSEGAEYQQAQALVYQEVRPVQAAIGSALQQLATQATELARERVHEARRQAQRTEWLLAGAVAAALAFGIAATVLITRGIVRPLGEAVAAAERVADGDLRVLRLPARRDETGRVLAALTGMQERLNALVLSIREAARAVGGASEQIAAGNSELAARTEEQAASLEETAASVEELTATVQQNSANAGRARELAATAAALATEGGAAVGGVVRSMEGIQSSSRKVADIVGVMDEIAFQTNLLALNAAVEAARAGDHGRGFGVVAAQVRVLAQRSAEAAREIKQLVGDARAQADHGAQAATRASGAIDKAVAVVRDVAQLVAEIALASEEQRSGVEQVNGTIAQLEGVTQSNNALVQEISGLAEGLLQQARELVQAAARFRLDGVAEAEAQPLAPAPAALPGGRPAAWAAAALT